MRSGQSLFFPPCGNGGTTVERLHFALAMCTFAQSSDLETVDVGVRDWLHAPLAIQLDFHVVGCHYSPSPSSVKSVP